MLLVGSQICFAYRPGAPVLTDLSCSLAAGRITTLLGPNGSGKSTLLRVLLGQLRPQSGTVGWQGRPVEAWRQRHLARLVAYLPQSQVWESGQTVGEVLRSGRTPYLPVFGVESPQDLQVVQEVAQRLELSDLLRRPMEELSGGQRQRVLVGRALVQQPQALLLDEPSTFLDLKHQSELLRLLKSLARERNIGILAASHDLSLSAAWADELILLKEGKVLATGAPDAVLQEALLSQVYGVPMQRLERPGQAPVVVPLL